MWSGLWQDTRHAARALLRRPVVTLAIVLSVVLGIGINTALFTVLDAVFFRPIPSIDDPERIVYLYSTSKQDPDLIDRRRFSHPNYRDFEEQMETVSALAAGQRVTVHVATGTEGSQQVEAFGATPQYFEVLGIEPSLGRFFTAEEDRARGAHPVVVVGHGFWQRELGSDPDVLGRTIRISGTPYTVVGVGPRGFQGTEVHIAVDLWVPLMMWPSLHSFGEYFDVRDVAIFEVFGRIAPDASRRAVDDEAQRIAAALEEEYSLQHHEQTVRASPIRDVMILPRERSDYETYGRTLVWGVLLVLLLCCINVAFLLVVQGRDRARELATRQALGAPPGRLFRRLLLEGVLLFLISGLLAAALAQGLARLLWAFRPPRFAAGAVSLDLDARTLAFLFGLTLLTGLATGLIPAWRASRSRDLSTPLRTGSEAPTSGGRFSLRALLVVPAISLAFLALVAGGLFYQGLDSRRGGDLGFEADPLVVMTVSPSVGGYTPDEMRRYYERLVATVEAVPGVVRAGLSEVRLLRGAPLTRQIYREGENVPPDGDDRRGWRAVSVDPGFFEAVGIELVRGRPFTATDVPDAPQVAVVNEYMAETEWPNRPAVGERFSFDLPTEPPRQIVGVAENAKYRYLDEEPEYFVYLPVAQETPGSLVLHARVEGNPAASVSTIRQAVLDLDQDVPISEEGTMSSYLDEALWKERSATYLLNAFGLLCLVLAAVGVYGLTRYSVRQRRREIGIRMALGAQRRDVVNKFLVETAVTSLLGVGLGLVLALSLVLPTVRREIPEVGFGSPWAYLLPAVLLLLAALFGAWMPARRAARLDPMEVLGTE